MDADYSGVRSHLDLDTDLTAPSGTASLRGLVHQRALLAVPDTGAVQLTAGQDIGQCGCHRVFEA